MADLDSALAAFNSSLASVSNAIGAANLDKVNRKFTQEEAEKQRDWNERMAAQTNAWNLENWQRQNEYNTPAQKRQRLLDAGLNPLYHDLDGAASPSGMADAAQPLGYQRSDYQSTINPAAVGLDAAVKAAQVQNIEASTQKVKSETSAIDAKLPYEVDSLRAQIRGSHLSSDAQEIVNRYLDQQQAAELRLKDANAAQIDAVINKAFAEIEKMDYEKVSMYMSWLETQEKILNLQKQRDLTDKQMEELSSLISVNNQTAKKIGLDVSNYDDITVIGTASHNMKVGPFSVQEGQPITLAMKKAAEEHRKSLEQAKKDKGKKFGHQSAPGQVSATDGSPYTGPIYD